jgi:hypothetical protein
MVKTRHASRWPADVASLVAGVAAPAVVLVVADEVTTSTMLLLVVWTVVPLHAGGRVLADARHGLACWKAARAGARMARGLPRAVRATGSLPGFGDFGGFGELASHAAVADATQRDTSHGTM